MPIMKEYKICVAILNKNVTWRHTRKLWGNKDDVIKSSSPKTLDWKPEADHAETSNNYFFSINFAALEQKIEGIFRTNMWKLWNFENFVTPGQNRRPSE